MSTKIYSTKDFKKGDYVWFCNIESMPSGKIKNNVKPIRVPISGVFDDKITLDFSGSRVYCCGFDCSYYIDNPNSTYYTDLSYRQSLGVHVSLTREESIEKYNEMIKHIIEGHYAKFKRIESNFSCYIL